MHFWIREQRGTSWIRPRLVNGTFRPSWFSSFRRKMAPCVPVLIIEDWMTLRLRTGTPLPLMSSAFELLQGAQVFTKLDLRNAYHLVRIREGDEWKMPFNTPSGHYGYLVLPFGLTNAPAVFQDLVNSVLGDINQSVCLCVSGWYPIFPPSLQLHTQHVRWVLQHLLENQLFVKAEKCEFHAASVTFLGHIISSRGIKPDPAKIEADAKWPVPDSRKALQRFLWFTKSYRWYIRNFGQIATPLTALTSTKVSFRWNQDAQVAFDT